MVYFLRKCIDRRLRSLHKLTSSATRKSITGCCWAEGERIFYFYYSGRRENKSRSSNHCLTGIQMMVGIISPVIRGRKVALINNKTNGRPFSPPPPLSDCCQSSRCIDQPRRSCVCEEKQIKTWQREREREKKKSIPLRNCNNRVRYRSLTHLYIPVCIIPSTLLFSKRLQYVHKSGETMHCALLYSHQIDIHSCRSISKRVL